MTYAYPKNITDPWAFVRFVNVEMTNYWLGYSFLIIIFSITFLSLKNGNHRMEDCIISSLWITSISSAFLAYLPDMLNGEIALLLFIVTALASVFLWKSK